MELTRPSSYSNLLGAAASGLCAVHCAVTPLIFAAKPVLHTAVGEHAHGSPLWAAFDYIFLVLSLVAVWYSTFAIGLLSEPFHLPYGSWLMYGGSIVLVVAHLKNFQYCRVKEGTPR